MVVNLLLINIIKHDSGYFLVCNLCDVWLLHRGVRLNANTEIHLVMFLSEKWDCRHIKSYVQIKSIKSVDRSRQIIIIYILQ